LDEQRKCGINTQFSLKEGDFVICSKMDGTGGYYIK
jgi:hypothetical protein